MQRERLLFCRMKRTTQLYDPIIASGGGKYNGRISEKYSAEISQTDHAAYSIYHFVICCQYNKTFCVYCSYPTDTWEGMEMYRRLRDLREDADLQQKELADYLPCSQVCYSYYETGKRDIPTDVLIRLARYYCVSTDYLLGLTDKKAPYPKPNRALDTPKKP